MHNESSFLAAQWVLQHGPDRHFSLWGPSSAKYLSGDRSKHACGDMDFPEYDNFSITVCVLWTLYNYSTGLELSCVSHHESELGRWVLALLNTTCLFFQLLAGVLFLPTLHQNLSFPRMITTVAVHSAYHAGLGWFYATFSCCVGLFKHGKWTGNLWKINTKD